MQLKQNLGTPERVIRISSGLIFLAVSLLSPLNFGWRTVFAIMGIGLLTSGLMGY